MLTSSSSGMLKSKVLVPLVVVAWINDHRKRYMPKNGFPEAIQCSYFMILELQGSHTIKRGSKGFLMDLLKSISPTHNSTPIIYIYIPIQSQKGFPKFYDQTFAYGASLILFDIEWFSM